MSLPLISVWFAEFYWQYKYQGNNRTYILAANYPQAFFTNLSKYYRPISSGLCPLILFHLALGASRAETCMYVHNWQSTVISHSYQRKVLGLGRTMEARQKPLCSKTRPDNHGTGQSIKPIISNLLGGGLNSSYRHFTMPTVPSRTSENVGGNAASVHRTMVLVYGNITMHLIIFTV